MIYSIRWFVAEYKQLQRYFCSHIAFLESSLDSDNNKGANSFERMSEENDNRVEERSGSISYENVNNSMCDSILIGEVVFAVVRSRFDAYYAVISHFKFPSIHRFSLVSSFPTKKTFNHNPEFDFSFALACCMNISIYALSSIMYSKWECSFERKAESERERIADLAELVMCDRSLCKHNEKFTVISTFHCKPNSVTMVRQRYLFLPSAAIHWPTGSL